MNRDELIKHGRCPIHADYLMSDSEWTDVKGGKFDGGVQKLLKCPRSDCAERGTWTIMPGGSGLVQSGLEPDESPFQRVEGE